MLYTARLTYYLYTEDTESICLTPPLKVKMPQGITCGVWILSIGIAQWCGTSSEDPRSEALRKCMALNPVESDGER